MRATGEEGEFRFAFDIELENASFECEIDFSCGFADAGEDYAVEGFRGSGAKAFQLPAGDDVKACAKVGEELEDGEGGVGFDCVADEVVAGAEGLLEELEAVGDLVGGIDVEGRSLAAGERLKGDFAAIQGGAGAGVVKRAGRGICFQGHKWFPWFGVSFEPTALGMAAEVWDGTGLQGRCWSPMILFPGLERAWS